MSPTKEGIVLRAISGVYTVQQLDHDHANGHLVHCSLRGNLKKEFQFTTSASFSRRVTRAKHPHASDSVAVGDCVRFVESKQGAGVIEEVLPRRTRFSRSGFRGREQTIVSNLDLVVVVFAAAEPRPDPWKLDRFLAAAESEEIEAVIVANKADRSSAEEIQQLFAEWSGIGYQVVATSAKTGDGIEKLRRLLAGKVSAFVGPSGVGKSSLLNTLQPGLNLRTGDIGYVTFKGRHTTTASQLIPLRSGGWVADTPGLRQFELLDVDRDGLIHCFREMAPLAGTCRFDNCRHESEPGCALKAAVEAGTVCGRRYESYLAIASEL